MVSCSPHRALFLDAFPKGKHRSCAPGSCSAETNPQCVRMIHITKVAKLRLITTGTKTPLMRSANSWASAARSAAPASRDQSPVSVGVVKDLFFIDRSAKKFQNLVILSLNEATTLSETPTWHSPAPCPAPAQARAGIAPAPPAPRSATAPNWRRPPAWARRMENLGGGHRVENSRLKFSLT